MANDEPLLLGRLARPALHAVANGVAGLAGLIELMQLDAEAGTPLADRLGLDAGAAERLRSLVTELQRVAIEDSAELVLEQTAGSLVVRRGGETLLTLRDC